MNKLEPANCEMVSVMDSGLLLKQREKREKEATAGRGKEKKKEEGEKREGRRI